MSCPFMALQGALDKSESNNAAPSVPRGGRFLIACPISGRSSTLTSPRAMDTSFCTEDNDLLDEQTTIPASPTRRPADRSTTQLGAILEDDSEGDEDDHKSFLQWGSNRNSIGDGFTGSEGSSFRKPRAVSPDAQMRREYGGSQSSFKSMSQVGSTLGIEVRMESASRCGGRPRTHPADCSDILTVARTDYP
jgi:hypothetical protein